MIATAETPAACTQPGAPDANGKSRAAADGTPAPANALDPPRAAWAVALGPIEFTSVAAHRSERVRLYTDDGAIDPEACARLEQIAAAPDDQPRPLSPRLEQLVVKAAYHFHAARVIVLSGWRAHAGKHTAGEALDFKLQGVRAATLASYLRGLARVGVGVYTHPRTQFVHLDVREPSYFWIDASPPGVHWREARLRDARADRRDAAWTPESDRP